MLTFEEAKNLRHGDILIDFAGKRWKVNGRVQLWKTRPEAIRVPLKHGLYSYDALVGGDFNSKGECVLLTKGV